MVAAPLAIVKNVYAAYPVNINMQLKPVAPLTDVNASLYGLETPPTPSPVGGNFTLEIHLENATSDNVPNGIQGLEVRIYFGDILEYAEPLGFEVRLGETGWVLNPEVLVTKKGFFNSTLGEVKTYPFTGAIYFWIAAASTGDPWFGADGLIAKITFRIIKQPVGMLYEPDVYFRITYSYSELRDGLNAIVNHDKIHGTLYIHASPFEYPSRPFIFIDPASKTGTMGEIFTVNVKITADAFWDVAGFDLTFTYDPVLLSVVSCSEGNFLKQHGETTFGWTDTSVPGRVWAVFTKLDNPTPSGGTDTLLTIQLQVIYEHDSYPPPTCVLGLENTVLASWAHPERTIPPWEGRITAVELPYDPRPVPPAAEWTHYTVEGRYVAPYIIPGPAIDIYTQYDSPFGGQGYHEHSDAFEPQMWVWLYAKVTYGGDRVTNKLVTFEVHNALDQKVTILWNKTDENGIATVGFRIPQTDYPCGHDPAIFGWWRVIATVSIDEVVVEDEVTFQVGWLIEVVSVEAVGDPYLKYVDPMVFHVVIQTISEQPRWGLVTVDAFDTAGYPIAEQYDFSYFNATRVQGDPHGTIPGVYEWTFTASIPTWARVGTGTVTAIVLTDWPRNGGTAYCPAISDLFGIKKS